MKITITKVLNRVKLLYVLRANSIEDNLNFGQLINKIDNLSCLIDSNLDGDQIESILEGLAIFSIEKDYPEYTCNPRCCPPWQQPDYIAAKKWYDSLSKEDRDKIDILINGSGPWC